MSQPAEERGAARVSSGTWDIGTGADAGGTLPPPPHADPEFAAPSLERPAPTAPAFEPAPVDEPARRLPPVEAPGFERAPATTVAFEREPVPVDEPAAEPASPPPARARTLTAPPRGTARPAVLAGYGVAGSGSHEAAHPSTPPRSPEPLDVTVVLPCYNEQGHVLEELARITAVMDASGYRYELLVIDDKSSDSTLALLRDALPDYPQMRLMPFARNGGSGTARRIGTTDARGEIVVWTDADMTYPNERIPEFVAYLEEHPDVDQVVGARTTEEGTHKWARVPAKWVIRRIASYLAATEIPDLNSGLRAFRRSVSLPYLRLLPPGFSCVTTITMAFLSNQHPVDYLAIDYAKRSGESKFHPLRDAYRYILQVLRMVMYFNPIKVLMPLALWLIGIGVIKGIVDLFVHDGRITTNALLLFITGLLIGSVALLADLIVRSRPD